MAKLRVFVSSTFYDLRHVRANLRTFIEGLGYEAVLSENGSVPFLPEMALDDSCYQELNTCDLVVLIIGGRYGSAVSKEGEIRDRLSKYQSITREEHQTAINGGIPVYVLVDRNVDGEFRTWQRNKDKPNIEYTTVDDPQIFEFIESIRSLAIGNPVFQFDNFSEALLWLKDQWSGLFKDRLKVVKEAKSLTDLSSQMRDLRDVVENLKEYQKLVVQNATKDDDSLRGQVETLDQSLRDRQVRRAKNNRAVKYIATLTGLSDDEIIRHVEEASSLKDLVSIFKSCARDEQDSKSISRTGYTSTFRHDIDTIRVLLNLDELDPGFGSRPEDDSGIGPF